MNDCADCQESYVTCASCGTGACQVHRVVSLSGKVACSVECATRLDLDSRVTRGLRMGQVAVGLAFVAASILVALVR